jgi:hypothetical protein
MIAIETLIRINHGLIENFQPDFDFFQIDHDRNKVNTEF